VAHSKKGYKAYNKKVDKFLGINKSTAMARLRKMILFELVKKAGMDRCHQCKFLIHDVAELSIEHIKPWLWKDKKLFWDLNNIAFSHLSCNSSAGQIKTSCGSYAKYLKGCKCSICRKKYLERCKQQYDRYYKRITTIKRLANLRTNKETGLYIKKMKKKYGFVELNQLIDKLKKESKK
tara:strand:+ start:917 stop:1453 length:537 start_codon:yes stop_codon:yes gene_type:complete